MINFLKRLFRKEKVVSLVLSEKDTLIVKVGDKDHYPTPDEMDKAFDVLKEIIAGAKKAVVPYWWDFLILKR